MNWIETQIDTASAGVDALCAMLTDLGIKGFAISDPADFQEFLQNKEGKWDYIDEELLGMAQGETRVTVYLPDNAQGAEQLVALRAMLARIHARDQEQQFGTLELTLKNVREEDWANNWKQYFKPFTVGEKLLIKPSWESCDNPENRAVLEIDPASSFGTGQHHTTRLCLELLEQLGLEHLMMRSLSHLSGGEAQKVLRARALAQEPRLLLLDEPTSNMDPRNQHEVMQLVRKIAGEKNICVITVLHDLNLAIRYCDRFLFLKDASVYASGGVECMEPDTIEAVYNMHVHTIEYMGIPVIVPFPNVPTGHGKEPE